MADWADAFIALPGGYGTLDEILKVIVSRFAHEHAKPLVLIDLDGYWREFERVCRRFVTYGFADSSAPDLLIKAQSADEALELLGIAEARA